MKRSCFVVTALSIILATSPLLISCSKTTTGEGQTATSDRDVFQAYTWIDDSGNSYLTIQSKNPIPPDAALPKGNTIKAVPANVRAPFRERAGFQTATYQLVSPTQTTLQLNEGPTSPHIYLVGETHLGKSQKEVAEILCKLIREHEIDAIFVEQPDDINYDWSKFKSLAENPRQTIAAVQYRMLSDADKVVAPPKLNMGKYDKYFKEGDITTDEGVKQILMNIYRDHGESGAREAMGLLEKQEAILKRMEPKVKASEQQYDRSEYLSATDYLYLLLNVQGIRLPFYNVDSPALRKEFDTNTDLEPRDTYMTDKIKATVTANGYRQVILICGALHLNHQRRNFTREGYQVDTSYDSLLESIKQTMAVLAKPEYVVNLVTQGPPPGFQASNLYMVENVPSSQLMTEFDNYFRANAGAGFNSQEIGQLRANFADSYCRSFHQRREGVNAF